MNDTFATLWDAPMSRRGWVTFDDRTGEVNLVGMQHGFTTIIGAKEVPGLGTVLTLHEVGGSHWAARGVRATHPSSISTILLGAKKEGGRSFKYVALGDNFIPKNDSERRDRSASLMRSIGLDDKTTAA
jgi:hypothetical protein